MQAWNETQGFTHKYSKLTTNGCQFVQIELVMSLVFSTSIKAGGNGNRIKEISTYQGHFHRFTLNFTWTQDVEDQTSRLTRLI